MTMTNTNLKQTYIYIDMYMREMAAQQQIMWWTINWIKQITF